MQWLEKTDGGNWVEMDFQSTVYRDSVIAVVPCERKKRGKEFVIEDEDIEALTQRLPEFNVAAIRPVPVDLFSSSPATPRPPGSAPRSGDASPVSQSPAMITPRTKLALPPANIAESLTAMKPVVLQASVVLVVSLSLSIVCF